MNSGKNVLGLDIGVGSIGWGLIQLREEKYQDENPDGTVAERYKIADGHIISTGIREFQLPQDRQKKSLALIRGSARRSRRTIRRKAKRLKSLIQLAREYDLIGEEFSHDPIFKHKKGESRNESLDVWRIRHEALQRKLSDIELFRVLYHIANHRGFYFHTKAEELEKEDAKSETGKAKAGMARVRKIFEEGKKEGKWQTVGQMFWMTNKQANDDKKRKRNTTDQYENSIPRTLLRDEIDEIFKEQRKLGHTQAREEFKERYIDEILMQEEGIDEEKLRKMMSKCEFVPEARCAPKESYTAERFMLYNRLNVLGLIDPNNKGELRPLNKEQKDKIAALAYKNTEVTFAQIRTELKLNNDLHLRFNLCSYREGNPEYTKKLTCEIKNGQLQFDEKHTVPIVDIFTGESRLLDEEIRKIFSSKKIWNNKIGVYYSEIRKQLNLPGNIRFSRLSGYTKSAEEFGSEAKYIKQFEEKDTFIKLTGYHKIKKAIEGICGEEVWESIRKDSGKLDAIAEALTYCKSDETRSDYLCQHGIADLKIIDAILTLNMKQLANFSQEAMKKLLEHMEKGCLFHEAKEKCGYGKIEHTKQMILDPYKGFYEKNPVVARVISQTRKLINAIVRKYSKTYPIDQIHIEVATELANSKKRKEEIIWGQARYREEKKRAEERCRDAGLDPEEGQNLLMFRLAEEQNKWCPYTGKAITFYPTGATNEVYIKDCEIDHIIPMSRSFNDSLNNKVLCSPEANQNKRDRIPFEWFEETYGKESQPWREFEKKVEKLYGMPYPKRKNLVRKSWTEKDKERFISRNLNDTRYAARHIADYLRKYFDFSESSRDDINKVSRIQLRSGGVTAFLRHMWGLSKDREESSLHHALDALVVACSTYGHVYLVSNLSKEIERKGKNWYKHFGKGKFKPWGSVREDIQKAVGGVFVSRMPRHKATAAAHKDTVSSFKKKPTKNRIIPINNGYAVMEEMIRADIFTDNQGKNYVVPIYAVDINSNKPLPERYVPDDGKLPYDQWPTVSDQSLEFRFSLFKDDLISINGKMYYVSFFEAATPNINVKNIDGSMFVDKIEAQDPYTKKIGYRPKRKNGKCVLKKYFVDMLGNYKELTKEKDRMENRIETRKKLIRKREKNTAK